MPENEELILRHVSAIATTRMNQLMPLLRANGFLSTRSVPCFNVVFAKHFRTGNGLIRESSKPRSKHATAFRLCYRSVQGEFRIKIFFSTSIRRRLSDSGHIVIAVVELCHVKNRWKHYRMPWLFFRWRARFHLFFQLCKRAEVLIFKWTKTRTPKTRLLSLMNENYWKILVCRRKLNSYHRFGAVWRLSVDFFRTNSWRTLRQIYLENVRTEPRPKQHERQCWYSAKFVFHDRLYSPWLFRFDTVGFFSIRLHKICGL